LRGAISEVITGVDIALGELPISACAGFAVGNGMVDVAELVRAVNDALNGCPK
jgi:hypothetical protein